MLNKVSAILFCAMIIPANGIAQGRFTAYKGLTPGMSTKADVDKVLGVPVKDVSPTLVEYRGPEGATKVYVQYRKNSVSDRIEVLLAQPTSRDDLPAELFVKFFQSVRSVVNSHGRLEEYFGAPLNVVLTHESKEISSAIIRVGYYSAALFAQATTNNAAAAKQSSADAGDAELTIVIIEPIAAGIQRDGDRFEVHVLSPKDYWRAKISGVIKRMEPERITLSPTMLLGPPGAPGKRFAIPPGETIVIEWDPVVGLVAGRKLKIQIRHLPKVPASQVIIGYVSPARLS